MSRWIVAGIAAVILLALGVGVGRSCYQGPTKVETRVDQTLTTVPAWQDTVKARDAVAAVLKRQRDQARRDRVAEGLRADSLEARAQALQSAANAASEIPVGISSSDSVGRLLVALAAQKKATAQFQLTVDTLQAHRLNDAVRLQQADQELEQNREWRQQDQARIDRLTKDLADLRADTKHKGDWNLPLGIHLPGWTKEAAFVAASAYVGYRVGKGSS